MRPSWYSLSNTRQGYNDSIRVEMRAKSARQERRGEERELYRRNFPDGMLSGNGMRACSACAGDYEDPDRTAGRPDEGDDELDDAEETLEEEFPADK